MTDTKIRAASSPAVLQTLTWARQRGFRPLPLHSRSKEAAVGSYTDLDYKPEPDEFWHKGDYGIGCILGPQRGGPIDIDLDCDEAIALAPDFMPKTPAVFGRPKKPRSHLLYVVDADSFDTKVFRDPLARNASGKDDDGKAASGKVNILELRGDGGNQTVLPGSLHEDTGEQIDWSEVPLPDVPTVDPEELTRAGRRLALACTPPT